jgi:hypothetical protein
MENLGSGVTISYLVVTCGLLELGMPTYHKSMNEFNIFLPCLALNGLQ